MSPSPSSPRRSPPTPARCSRCSPPPPLEGTALALAGIAAVCCGVGTLAILVWRRLPQVFLLAVGALGFATACATPTLVALTWDQRFTAAHPWAVALAVAACWSTVVSLVLFVPVLLGRLLVMRAFPAAPLHQKHEPKEARDAKIKARLASPTLGPPPPLPRALFGALWNTAVLAQPLPLVYLTLRALW